MTRWDWVCAALCACWLLTMYFIAEPEPVWDWRVVAAFTQAILSAGAIYSAWWLQSRKRDADRREQERDTWTTFQAATWLAELDIAHIVSCAMAGGIDKSFALSISLQLKETDAILRRQNLGHLPAKALVPALDVMRWLAQFTGLMSAIASGSVTIDADDGTLASSYDSYFEERSAFLVACGLTPEPDRIKPADVKPYERKVPKAKPTRK